MRLTDHLCHLVFLHADCRLQQTVRQFNGFDQFLPPAVLYRPDKLLPDLFIGYIDLSLIGIIGQIAQMHQKGQHVIPASQRSHIILKRTGIYPASVSAQHVKHRILQSVKIQLHIKPQRFIGLRLCPIVTETAVYDRFNDRIRTENMTNLVKLVAVVPSACLVKIHTVLFT